LHLHCETNSKRPSAPGQRGLLAKAWGSEPGSPGLDQHFGWHIPRPDHEPQQLLQLQSLLLEQAVGGCTHASVTVPFPKIVALRAGAPWPETFDKAEAAKPTDSARSADDMLNKSATATSASIGLSISETPQFLCAWRA